MSKPGVYIILPRTNGLGFNDDTNSTEITKLIRDKVTEKYDLGFNEITESTIIDIFRKFDMLLTRRLTFR